jgi:hypothetical protein
MCPSGQRYDLDDDVRLLGCPGQRPKLLGHDLGASDWSPQCRLVEQGPQLRRVLVIQNLLAFQAGGYSLIQLFIGRADASAEDCPRVRLSLQEARHDGEFEIAQAAGVGLVVGQAWNQPGYARWRR